MQFEGKLREQMALHLLECRDLDGDGTPEVLLAFSPNTSIHQSKAQLTLVLLSLKDGKTRWRTTLGPPDRNSLLTSSDHLHLGLADLDGDGVLDVVTWAVADDDTFEVRALGSRDGSLLWRRSLARPAGMLLPRPVVAAGELGGRPVVVVYCSDGEVWALDRAGEREWVWKELADRGDFLRPVPLFLDLAGGGRGVCVREAAHSLAVVLDARGHELQRVAGLRVRSNRSLSPAPIHDDSVFFLTRAPGAAAASGLLSVDGSKLRLMRGGIAPEQVVWEWPLPGGDGEVMDVLGEGERTTVVVRAGNAAHGLDGATGRARWRCAGPCPPTGLLPTSDPIAPPHVLFAQDGGATTCCRALALGPEGRFLLPAGETITPEPLPEDPRLRVPLPWSDALPSLLELDWQAFLLVQALILVMAGLGWSAAWFFRRGARGLGLLLILLLLSVAALGVGLVYLRFEAKFTVDIFRFLANLFVIALNGLPALVFAIRLVVWALQGRWRRVGLLLIASALLTLPLAAFILWEDAPNLGPTQHYATDGWYIVWVMGAYVTGALLVAWWLLRAAFRAVRRAGRWALRLVR